MQSSMVVAGMDALSAPRKHFDTSGKSPAPFHHRAICKTPMALPKNGRFGAIAVKKSLPTIEVPPARHRARWADWSSPGPRKRGPMTGSGVIRRSRPQTRRKSSRAGAASRSALAELADCFGVAAPIDRKHSRAHAAMKRRIRPIAVDLSPKFHPGGSRVLCFHQSILRQD